MPKPLVGKRQRGHVKRHLKSLEPKLVEDVKVSLLLKGHKCSDEISKVMKDIAALQAPNAKVFSKKNEILPFENDTHLERLLQKNDAGLFVFGSHNKKRPNNLILGRTFDNHVLDMIEVGVTNYISMDELHKVSGISKVLGSTPCMVFQGDGFAHNLVLGKLKNLLIDMFKGRQHTQVDLAALDHVIVCTSSNDSEVVSIRTYGIGYRKRTAEEKSGSSDVAAPSVELLDMGPHLDLTVRRTRFAAETVQKVAYRVPKAAKGARKIKNITRNELDGKVGRVHMHRQDMNKLVTRSRFKALKKRGTANSMGADVEDFTGESGSARRGKKQRRG